MDPTPGFCLKTEDFQAMTMSKAAPLISVNEPYIYDIDPDTGRLSRQVDEMEMRQRILVLPIHRDPPRGVCRRFADSIRGWLGL